MRRVTKAQRKANDEWVADFECAWRLAILDDSPSSGSQLGQKLDTTVPPRPVAGQLMVVFREHAAQAYAWALLVWNRPPAHPMPRWEDVERSPWKDCFHTAVKVGWLAKKRGAYVRGRLNPIRTSTSLLWALGTPPVTEEQQEARRRLVAWLDRKNRKTRVDGRR